MTDVSIDLAPGASAVAAASAPVGSTLLEQVKAAITGRAPRKPLELVVPDVHPRVTLRCAPTVSVTDLERWQQWSRPDNRTSPDATMLAGHVLVNTCVGITVGGVAVTDEGAPVTFKSKVLHQMFGALDPVGAVRALFGNEFHMITASDMVLGASGFGEGLQALDPTGG